MDSILPYLEKILCRSYFSILMDAFSFRFCTYRVLLLTPMFIIEGVFACNRLLNDVCVDVTGTNVGWIVGPDALIRKFPNWENKSNALQTPVQVAGTKLNRSFQNLRFIHFRVNSTFSKDSRIIYALQQWYWRWFTFRR